MLSIIALTIIAIGIVSTLGYGVLSTIRATESVTMAQRNVAQVETIASLLRASVRPMGGVPRAPMGDKIPTPGGTIQITGLPDWIGGSRTTPWGAPYAYCPYALLDAEVGGEPAVPVIHGDGSDGHTVVARHGYVVSDDAAPPAAGGDKPLMFVLSPIVGKPVPPRCDDVVLDGTGAYRIRADASVGGTVTAITHASLAVANLPGQETTMFVAPIPAGDGSGRDPGSVMALADALSLWQSNLPRALTIRMAAGTYDLTQVDLANLAEGGAPGRGLRIVGDGVAVIAPSEDVVELALPTDATLEGVAVAGGIPVRPLAGTRLRLKDSTVPRVDAEGADVVVEGAVTVTGAGTPVGGAALRVGGGRLTVAGGAVLSATLPGGAAGGSAAAVRLDTGAEASLALGSALHVESSRYGVWIDGGAALTAWGADIKVSGTIEAAFFAGGSLLGLYGTPVSFGPSATTVGRWIHLHSGTLDMRSLSRLGSPTQRALVGVEDDGGHALSGDAGVQVHAAAGGACFHGDLFGGGDLNGPANFAVTGALAVANRAEWSCQ